ncbi:sugar O-acetyltransferase [Thomasclavelia sp.]|uniref:sugar O-acetyltransferase n=1 Tax=Thomasclavelia sp. TaxID=3025757 RepID=UPI0025D629B2|nr:sugar O-acetyltransferase [Thomasclavelia sp.]
MKSGIQVVNPSDGNNQELYIQCKKRLQIYNQTTIDEYDKRKELLADLFKQVGKNSYVEPPFYCDYGKNITVGDHFYANYNCIMVDTAKITIGSYVKLGPGVHIYCANHPLDSELRKTGVEYFQEVKIEDNVWIGGNVTINPGITIGKNSVIASGSVVTKDIPENVLAGGNPCRIIRYLDK